MRASPERLAAGTVRPCRPAAANSFISSSSFGLTIRPRRREAGGSFHFRRSTLTTLVGRSGSSGLSTASRRPSGSGAKVRHGMRGQRYAGLNLDLHAVLPGEPDARRRSRRVCILAPTNHNAAAQKKRASPGTHRRSSSLGGWSLGHD